MEVKTLVVGDLKENCYIVSKDNTCLIVDPGSEFNKIDEYIEKNKYKVLGILITHYHFDHISALKLLQEKYRVNVIDFNNIGKQIIDTFDFEVIPFKGHKEDLVCFYFEKENIMFTGDFIFKGSIGRVDLPGGNALEMKDSLKKITKFSLNTILYPGHGDKTTLKEEINNNPYLLENRCF